MKNLTPAGSVYLHWYERIALVGVVVMLTAVTFPVFAFCRLMERIEK